MCTRTLSRVWLFVTPWNAACQAPLSITTFLKTSSRTQTRELLQGAWVWPWQLWALWARTLRGGPGQGLQCLHSSHSRSRYATATVVGLDFSVSALVTLWKQLLRDTKGNCQHIHAWGEVKAVPTTVSSGKRWRWHNRAYSQVHIAPVEQYSVALLVRGFQSYLPCTADQKWIWGPLLPTTWEQTLPQQDSDKHRPKRRPGQYPVQALITTTSVTAPIKGIMASTHGRSML